MAHPNGWQSGKANKKQKKMGKYLPYLLQVGVIKEPGKIISA
jgi:hypothetical protein